MTWKIRYDTGTIVVEVAPEERSQGDAMLSSRFVWDGRIGGYRASARSYRWLLLALTRAKIDYVDEARAYTEIGLEFRFARSPYFYQTATLDAWNAHGG